jgi:hypothetical protein
MKLKYLTLVNSQTDTTCAIILCALGLRRLSNLAKCCRLFFVTVLRRTVSKIGVSGRLVFWAFDQSAPVFLKGYFIMKYMKWHITSDIISRISVIIYDWMQACTYSSMPSWNKGPQNINIENGVIMQSFTRQLVI